MWNRGSSADTRDECENDGMIIRIDPTHGTQIFFGMCAHSEFNLLSSYLVIQLSKRKLCSCIIYVYLQPVAPYTLSTYVLPDDSREWSREVSIKGVKINSQTYNVPSTWYTLITQSTG